MPSPASAQTGHQLSELVRIQDYLSRNLFAWGCCDSVSAASANVGSFIDRVYLPANGGRSDNARSIVSNHAFTQASPSLQVALPSVDSSFNNQLSTTWSAASYSSTLSSTNWLFLANLSRVWLIHLFTSLPSTEILIETSFGADGCNDTVNSAGSMVQSVYRNPTALQFNALAGITTGSARLTRLRYEPTVLGARSTGLTETTTAVTGTATTVNKPLEIGSRGGGAPFKGRLVDILIAGANATDATLDSLVNRYAFLRYGVSP